MPRESQAVVSEAQIAAFYKKVGSSPKEARTSTKLNWSSRSLADDDCVVLAHIVASGALPRLEKLSLVGNEIGNDGIAALATAVGSGALPSLTVLDFRGNQIGDAGADKIAAALPSLPNLKERM